MKSILRDPEGQEYTLNFILGQGTFGAVWEAKDSDGYPVAIKIVSPDRTTTERFLDEVRLLEAIQPDVSEGPDGPEEPEEPEGECSPFVVCLLAYWSDSDGFYLVTELLDGYNLDQYLDDVEQCRYVPDLYELLGIMGQIVEGVEWLHQNGVVHRDLNPGNIMIGDDQTVKILDLGMGCFVSGKEPSCQDIRGGTPRYLAPEVWNKEIRDAKKLDIFALGALFFTIATGRNLFYGWNVQRQILRNIHAPVETGSELLDELILTMIDPDPEQRPTIEEVVDVLDSLDEPIPFPILEGNFDDDD